MAKVAGSNAGDFISIDAAGQPHVDLEGITRAKLAAVQSIDSEQTEHGVRARIKTHDKLKALDMLAKMARLYPAERQEITGAGGGPIATANLHVNAPKIDLEALEPEQRAALKTALLALKAKANADGS